MLDNIKKMFQKEKPTVKKLSPKEQATKAGQPYVEILGINVDGSDPGQGSFDLDWNDIFVARLIKAVF